MKSLITLILVFILITTVQFPKRNEMVVFESDEKYTSDTHSSIIHNAINMPQKALVDKKTMDYSSSEIERLICQYFGDIDCKIAIAIAKAESGLRCEAVGDGHLDPKSYGVFQIRGFATRPPVAELLDCEKNIAYAKQMFDRQGWGPWSAYTSGIYLKHL